MSTSTEHATGTIGWVDLTVPDAEITRDFYHAVVGWNSIPLDMGGYADYVMIPPGSEEGVAGVCHARGENLGIPPVWLIYVYVDDIEVSIRRCEEKGGKVLSAIRKAGDGLFAVIRDPAGAVMAIYQKLDGKSEA